MVPFFQGKMTSGNDFSSRGASMSCTAVCVRSVPCICAVVRLKEFRHMCFFFWGGERGAGAAAGDGEAVCVTVCSVCGRGGRVHL